MERTGFIDPPLIGPATSTPRNTAAPMARPACSPRSFAFAVTPRIVIIRKSPSRHSSANARGAMMCGECSPSVGDSGSSARTVKLAANAPTNCATTYPGTCRHGNRPASANPTLTAGFRCAPEMSPSASIMANTTSPQASDMPMPPSDPCVTASTATAPVAANTRKYVPSASAASRVGSHALGECALAAG